MTGDRTIFEPHLAIFIQPTPEGILYTLSHNFPDEAGFNAFDVEAGLLQAASGVLAEKGYDELAEQVGDAARAIDKDSDALDEITGGAA